MDYEIYHDESNELGFWHGLLFLPEESKQDILKYLKKIREKNGYDEITKLNFKRLKKRAKQFYAISTSLDLLKLITRRRFLKEDCYCDAISYCFPENGQQKYETLLEIKRLYNVKFVILKERDNHKKMEGYPDHASKVETTFRFALKGGAHFMFNQNNPINIRKVYFDGHEHHHRTIDQERIIKNLDSELKDYCKIDKKFEVDDRQLSERKDDSFIIMNFIDNIVSAWRCLINNQYGNSCQAEVVKPLNELYDRWLNGTIKQSENCRWYKSFSLSECFLEDIGNDQKWQFPDVKIDKKDGRLPI